MIVPGLLASLAGGCSEQRDRPAQTECVAYDEDLRPDLEARCVECHGGDMPAGSYSVETYLQVLGTGTDDVANAIAGDESSTLLRVLDPEGADETHAPFVDLHPELRQWVVDCELAKSSSPIHEAGILDPRSADFHGALLAESAWDFEACARCHGDDFTGGPAEAPCTTCHEEGPTACRTCHTPDELDSGAHAAHLDATSLPSMFEACNACHSTPETYSDPGHILTEDGSPDPPPAEVTFGPLAAATLDPDARSGPPTYVEDTGTCQNVYCHGDVLGDTEAEITQPNWFATGEGQADCGTCHGLPPSSHPDGQGECQLCHQRVTDGEGPPSTELHVDGQVQLGRFDDGCTACHGSGNAAPPVDLRGRSSTDAVTVGAHQSHVVNPALSDPVPCAACHAPIDDLDDPGHIDTAWPAEVRFSGLATAGGATPEWDRDTATCGDVYCHGGGSLADADGFVQEPVWTAVGQGEVFCGSCHGIPPVDAIHEPDWDVTRCNDCHPSVDSNGGIVYTGPADDRTTAHMNGEIDLAL